MRRRGGSHSPEQLAEMGAGRLLSRVLRDPVCQVDDFGRRWCPVCDGGHDCRSNFDTADAREAFYWLRRDEILADDQQPGRRPWSYWAPGCSPAPFR